MQPNNYTYSKWEIVKVIAALALIALAAAYAFGLF
jgi:hypothetical protein